MSIMRPSRKVIMVIGAVLFLCHMTPLLADDVAGLPGNAEFLGYMEQIAEDIEEIHHDMHKVSFALRLSAYSQAGIALILLLMLAHQVITRKR